MKKQIRLVVVQSKSHPDLLSIRLADTPDAATATDIRRALASSGFKVGDVLTLRQADVRREPKA